MREIKKILCAIDIYDFSEDLIEYTKSMAGALQAHLTFLYVVSVLEDYVEFTATKDNVEAMKKSILENARQDMDEFIRDYFKNYSVSSVLVVGDPAEEILDYEEKNDIDLLITATHGRKGIDRLLNGSVAEIIIKNSQAPVLTVGPGKTL